MSCVQTDERPNTPSHNLVLQGDTPIHRHCVKPWCLYVSWLLCHGYLRKQVDVCLQASLAAHIEFCSEAAPPALLPSPKSIAGPANAPHKAFVKNAERKQTNRQLKLSGPNLWAGIKCSDPCWLTSVTWIAHVAKANLLLKSATSKACTVFLGAPTDRVDVLVLQDPPKYTQLTQSPQVT